MPIKDWSTTPSNNNAAAPYGFPEGMAASALNDAARQVMADIRAWFEDSCWVNLGLTPTRLSATQFTVPGDYTSQFTVGRSLRFTGSATAYGKIQSVSFSTVTTVTMTASVIPATLSTVSLATVDTNSVPTTSLTAAELLALLITVDGPGSGLDADSVDGINGVKMLRHGGSQVSGVVTVSTSAPTGGSDGDIWLKV